MARRRQGRDAACRSAIPGLTITTGKTGSAMPPKRRASGAPRLLTMLGIVTRTRAEVDLLRPRGKTRESERRNTNPRLRVSLLRRFAHVGRPQTAGRAQSWCFSKFNLRPLTRVRNYAETQNNQSSTQSLSDGGFGALLRGGAGGSWRHSGGVSRGLPARWGAGDGKRKSAGPVGGVELVQSGQGRQRSGRQSI